MKNITGQRFGSLVALRFSHSGKNHMNYWVYKCDCGNEHIARTNTIKYELRKGDLEIPSCGCIELKRKTKHGFRTVKNTHPAYRAYRGIMGRCYNPEDHEYKWYGAVGITICNEWKDNPESFVKWSIENGWASGLHIDKDIICKAKGISPHVYSPETCQWVTAKVNVGFATNRDNFGKHPNVKLSHNDVSEIERCFFNEEMNKSELARKYKIAYSSIHRLIKIANARLGVTS